MKTRRKNKTFGLGRRLCPIPAPMAICKSNKNGSTTESLQVIAKATAAVLNRMMIQSEPYGTTYGGKQK